MVEKGEVFCFNTSTCCTQIEARRWKDAVHTNHHAVMHNAWHPLHFPRPVLPSVVDGAPSAWAMADRNMQTCTVQRQTAYGNAFFFLRLPALAQQASPRQQKPKCRRFLALLPRLVVEAVGRPDAGVIAVIIQRGSLSILG